MRKFIQIFKKVNGKEILKQYLNAHILLYAFGAIAINGFSPKSLEIVRLMMNQKIMRKCRNKYRTFISNYKRIHDFEKLEHKSNNQIWVCWLQGIEKAPGIVKICLASLREHLEGREIILITEDNFRDWITLPGHIEKKYQQGLITKTHLSDLIRLELLITYGGTWIDATVFCSGNNIPNYLFSSDLFMYQCMKPGLDGHATRISSWFITAKTNNAILTLTRDLLYKYWETHNKMIDYFLIHDMIELSIEAYPEEWDKVIPTSNSIPHILLLRFDKKFDKHVWEEIKKMTPFHKLTYKFDSNRKNTLEEDDTFYNITIKKYLY